MVLQYAQSRLATIHDHCYNAEVLGKASGNKKPSERKALVRGDDSYNATPSETQKSTLSAGSFASPTEV